VRWDESGRREKEKGSQNENENENARREPSTIGFGFIQLYGIFPFYPSLVFFLPLLPLLPKEKSEEESRGRKLWEANKKKGAT
jgi:hypothetical protein